MELTARRICVRRSPGWNVKCTANEPPVSRRNRSMHRIIIAMTVSRSGVFCFLRLVIVLAHFEAFARRAILNRNHSFTFFQRWCGVAFGPSESFTAATSSISAL